MKKSLAETQLCGVTLANPVILASGILGTSAELMARVAKSGAGAVTPKSCSLEPRVGHKNPTVLATEHFIINAVGFTNPGASETAKEIKKFKQLCPNTPIIASIFADTAENFGKVASIVATAEPDLIEADISCPNVDEKFSRPFLTSQTAASEVVGEIKRASSIPLIIKISPIFSFSNAIEVAQSVEAAGASAINAVNTLGPGMVIDTECGKPILENKTGGVSGPAIKPIAVRAVYEISKAVKIPVIGTGGVTYGVDAAEMIMAGASAVGVGSAVYYRGPEALGQIAKELEQFMRQHKYASLNEFRGISHKQ